MNMNHETQKFNHLIHFTTLRNFESIQDQNALLNPFERRDLKVKFSGVASTSEIDLNDAFPGIYMTALNDYDIDMGLDAYDYEEDVIFLVFSPSLLKRRDWHLNLEDQNGYIDDSTYCAETINMYPADVGEWFEEEKGYSWAGNELVFHNKVTLQCLVAIWVESEAMKQKVLSKLTINVAVHVRSSVPATPSPLIPHFVPSPRNMEMKLCFGVNANSLHDKNKHLSKKVRMGLLKNCALPITRSLMEESPEDLNRSLLERFFMTKEAVAYPPFQ